MKNKKRSLWYLLFSLLAVGVLVFSYSGHKDNAFREPEAAQAEIVTTLNSTHAPTTSTTYVDEVSYTGIAYATYTYTKVKYAAGKLATLDASGTLTKDVAKGLISIKVIFDGELKLKTWYNAVPTEVEYLNYNLTSDTLETIAGNYFLLTAQSETTITSITLTYSCTEASTRPAGALDGLDLRTLHYYSLTTRVGTTEANIVPHVSRTSPNALAIKFETAVTDLSHYCIIIYIDTGAATASVDSSTWAFSVYGTGNPCDLHRYGEGEVCDTTQTKTTVDGSNLYFAVTYAALGITSSEQYGISFTVRDVRYAPTYFWSLSTYPRLPFAEAFYAEHGTYDVSAFIPNRYVRILPNGAPTYTNYDGTFAERIYTDTSTLAIDGLVNDWVYLEAFSNSVSVNTTTASVKHKRVDFYSALTTSGLYVAASAYHDIYISESEQWWQSTNFEFFVHGNNQYWISARQEGGTFTKSAAITSANMITKALNGASEGLANYFTFVEAFIPNANLPAGAVLNGEVRVGFAWKTAGDQIDNGEDAGGALSEYWVPKGTWANNSLQPYVTAKGIFKKSQLATTAVVIDGNLDDWSSLAAYTTNKVYIESTAPYAHKNVTFYAFLNAEGLFVAATAHHDKYTVANPWEWYKSTNFEFFVGTTQYYISAKGHVSVGSGAMVSGAYAGAANYETTAEVFIPKALLPAGDYVRVGFAWKTPGDLATGLGANWGGEDDYWVPPSHWPNNTDEQYYVNGSGIFTSAP
ncbi:MAG: hypothetical protein BWX74_00746 [Tenericutes bacterium ADurb.Bin087]|nr:MAG: hypothetical protein BWX74_00746 [Tenericutes bacterium ADurb.Bin087]